MLDARRVRARLAEAHRDRDIAVTVLTADARWDSLRNDPRFQDIAERVGF